MSCRLHIYRPILDYLKVLVVDEYDECFRTAPEAMALIMSSVAMNNNSGSKPQVGPVMVLLHLSMYRTPLTEQELT
jgi:hypothetical protein